MTLPLIGELALWIALLFMAWGVVTSAAAGTLRRRDLAISGTRAIHAAGVMLLLAVLALATSLVRDDFTLTYVAAFGGVTATPREMLTALWAAPPGALMVLAFVMAMVASIVVSDRIPATSAAFQLVMLGVLATLLGSESPFERLPFEAGDGRGLPPQLRGSVSLIVWPLWAIAAGAATAALALAIGSALDPSARHTLGLRARRWVLGAWTAHSAALLMALWWSYGLASGEASWLARAVRPGAFVAWVALGVAAHLSVIEHRWRPGVRTRVVLLALPLSLLLVSAMLGAEGGWQPLHELAHGIAGAWWIVLVVATLQVLAYALFRGRGAADSLAAEATADRSLGARLAHVGFVITLAGLAAGRARHEEVLTFAPAESVTMTDAVGQDWRIVYQGLSTGEERNAFGEARWRELLLPVALVRTEGGAAQELLVPEVREHVDLFGRPTAPPWPRPAIHHGLIQDIIVEPDSIGAGEDARLRISFALLPGLVWLGGAVLILGAGLSLPGQRR